MTAKEVEEIFLKFLKEDSGVFSRATIEKMDILCDKQWHAFNLPSESIRLAARNWVKTYIEIENHDPEIAAKVVYCFGLEKVLLQQIIDSHRAINLAEFEQDIEMSEGEFVDPYWSLRENG
ncbi:hypothetical protein CLH61_17905 [Marinobacter profundi]|uniref:Uncharacterized protein n=2 Tax=Marinobacteraceae TaxID=2887365 RepID=A0A2G1UGF5_9GAMM|nr:hypothetical protein CLH61_17905 [Marinobacter profundi]